MQTTLSRQGTASAQLATQRSSAGCRQQLALAPRRRKAGQSAPTVCFGASLSSSPSAITIVSQLLTTAAWGAVLWLGARMLLQEEKVDQRDRRECGTCGGTGYVDCLCTRWSDKDVGCGSCRGSGKMACHSCGGGGTAVPIEARIVIRPEKDYYK